MTPANTRTPTPQYVLDLSTALVHLEHVLRTMPHSTHPQEADALAVALHFVRAAADSLDGIPQAWPDFDFLTHMMPRPQVEQDARDAEIAALIADYHAQKAT